MSIYSDSSMVMVDKVVEELTDKYKKIDKFILCFYTHFVEF